jgi:hypothetical protein
MGLTEFSFLFCLKLIILIIYILLNICLLYTEYLEIKSKKKYNPDTHLKSSLVPELKRIAKNFIISVGVISSTITVKNEYVKQETKATLKEQVRAALALARAEEEAKKTKNEETANNFIHKLNITNISQSYAIEEEAEEEESELKKAIKERRVQ